MVVDGKFTFTEEQAKAILEIRLSRLTGLERDKIIAELKQLGSEIAHNLAILADRNKILAIISEELNKIKEDFAIARRTTVEEVDGDTDAEDLIEPDDVMISITNNGYIKRTSSDVTSSPVINIGSPVCLFAIPFPKIGFNNRKYHAAVKQLTLPYACRFIFSVPKIKLPAV